MAAIVQYASNTLLLSSGGTSQQISATFGSNITAGHCVVAFIGVLGPGGTAGGTINSVNTNGASENWFSEVNGGALSAWLDPGATGGNSTVTVNITLNNPPNANLLFGLNLEIYEISGVATSSVVDQVATQSTSNTSWSSGSTATTQANEVWIGADLTHINNASSQLSGPLSPWTNNAVIFQNSENNFGIVTGWSQISGYQVVSSPGNAVYSGTSNQPGSVSFTLVITLLEPPLPPATMTMAGIATMGQTGIATQKLIVSMASESGTTSDGFVFPAGVGVYGTGAVLGYSAQAATGDLITAVAPQAGTDSLTNAYPPGFLGPQLTFTKNSSPTTQSGTGFLWVDSSGNLWYQSPAGTQTKLASN